MEHIALRLIDPSTNRFRFFSITEMPTLFGELALVIAWGRLGQLARVRSEVFDSPADLAQRKARLLAVRRRHGYTQTLESQAST